CINKWDLVPAEDLFRVYDRAGFHTLKVSAKTGEGIETLRRLLAGKISGLTGNSGVGKSSILNALDPTVQIPVGEVSAKLGRGKHTTRHIELWRLPGGGLIADTPGFAAFEIPELREKEAIEKTFREFAPYLDQCRFIGCPHCRGKGCAVLDAVAEGKIAKSRHESYVKLYEQAKEHKAWQDD
ncbi:MAG: ribosome small subunit-dependent GTPase A, partial [Evtepia sp.]